MNVKVIKRSELEKAIKSLRFAGVNVRVLEVTLSRSYIEHTTKIKVTPRIDYLLNS